MVTKEERAKKYMILFRNGVIDFDKDKKQFKINGKFAFDFFQRQGVAPEILEEWVNDYLKD